MSENELGTYLKAQRASHKLSIRKAAEVIGIDRMRLSDLERGINRATDRPTRPSKALTERIARVYQVPADYLLDLAGYPRSHPDMDEEARLLLEFFRDLDAGHRALALNVIRDIHAAYKLARSMPQAAERVDGWEPSPDAPPSES